MQGFNMGRYVPPELEGTTSGNRLHGKRPPGTLSSSGTQTVRFELPFPIWCTTCKPHATLIGQGVRFNAQKHRVGNYHSTPIWAFRFKHTACSGWIEIRTDPQNTAYVVTEGARKRDYGEDKEGAGEGEGEIRIVLPSASGAPGVEKDPFERLEKDRGDKLRARTEAERVEEIKRRVDRDWGDPYEQSRKLRRAFRDGRHLREKEQAKTEALKDKLSLDIEVLAEIEEDRVRASLIDFATTTKAAAAGTDSTPSLRSRSMFDKRSSTDAIAAAAMTSSDGGGGNNNSPHLKRKKKKKNPTPAEIAAEKKARLQLELSGNTRAVIDPFLSISENANTWRPSRSVSKRRTAEKEMEMENAGSSVSNRNDTAKKSVDAVAGDGSEEAAAVSSQDDKNDSTTLSEETLPGQGNVKVGKNLALVDYGSDSD